MRKVFLILGVIFFTSLPLTAQPVEEKIRIPPTGAYAQINVAKSNLAVATLMGSDETAKQERITEVLAHPENFNPPALFALANALFQTGQKDEALFWFYAGILRGSIDENICKDESAKSALGILISQFGQDINPYALENLDKFDQTLIKIMEWDKTTPAKYDRRWINLHGMNVMLSSLQAQQGRPQKGVVLSAPKKQWDKIIEKSRSEFLVQMKTAIESLKGQKVAADAGEFTDLPVAAPGFLVPSQNSIPPGFKEISRVFRKNIYTMVYARPVDSRFEVKGDSRLVFTENAKKACDVKKSAQPFTFKGVDGQIVVTPSVTPKGLVSYNLYWNDEGKCLSIVYELQPVDQAKPEDVIHILETLTRS